MQWCFRDAPIRARDPFAFSGTLFFSAAAWLILNYGDDGDRLLRHGGRFHRDDRLTSFVVEQGTNPAFRIPRHDKSNT
jgi:hypothetical protein